MARRIDTEGERHGLREHLIAKTRMAVVKLETADTDIYDFTPELRRQQDRLLDLQAGRGVLVYRFEIPRELQPLRDGTHVYTLHGDRLVAHSPSASLDSRSAISTSRESTAAWYAIDAPTVE